MLRFMSQNGGSLHEDGEESFSDLGMEAADGQSNESSTGTAVSVPQSPRGGGDATGFMELQAIRSENERLVQQISRLCQHIESAGTANPIEIMHGLPPVAEASAPSEAEIPLPQSAAPASAPADSLGTRSWLGRTLLGME